ncbi:MAG: XdhC family protein [Planctomycetales bacterium]|nr:XdhC family protein [Planctomycetales bacterium]
MRELFTDLFKAVEESRPVACCRIVATRGSTPQKAGAAMLVFADGSQAGTLGGGCVEADVKRKAITLIEQGDAEIVHFQLDDDYGWDDGLICGGRMSVLIEPIRSAGDAAYFQTLYESGHDGYTEAIVFDEASGLAAPACYAIAEDGRLLAANHYGRDATDVPQAIRDQLPPPDRRGRPSAAHGVAMIPAVARCRLLIVGAGHVGQAVARLASQVEFDVWIVDDRGDFASAERFPTAERIIVGPPAVLKETGVTANTYCLIVTRGHNHDEESLLYLAQRGARYVGMIGSRRKIKLIFDDLLAEGIAAEALSAVHAPVGIDIGSQTVPEIAVSIVAELIAHRNLHGQVPGRPAAVSVAAAE